MLSLDAENSRRVANNVRFLVGSGAPTNGVAGTGAVDGAGPGSFYFDFTNAVVYFQTGLLGNPTWISFTASLGPGSVQTGNIAANAITTALLAAAAVGTGQIAANAITQALIAAGAVGTAQIANQAITQSLMAPNSVGVSQIIAGNVGTAAIANGAITTALLAGNAVGPAQTLPSMFAQTVLTIASVDITGTGVGQLSSAAGYPIVPAPGVGAWYEWISTTVFYKFVTAAYNNAGGNVRVTEGAGGPVLSANANTGIFTGGAGTIGYTFFPNTNVQHTPNVPIYLQATTPYTNPGTAAGVIQVTTNYRILNFI